MRCPTCGARNATTAAWCTQCYADLRPPPPPSPPRSPGEAAPGGSAPAVDTPEAAAPGDVGADDDVAGDDAPDDVATEGPSTVEVEGLDVRTVDGEVEWRCHTCEGWSPLTTDRCLICSSPRTGFGDPPPRPDVAPGDRARLLVASVLLPGLGHLFARRAGTGVARAVLYLSWLAGGAALGRAASGSGASVLPAVPLLLGAGVLWAGTLADATTLGSGREVLGPRVLA
ncbi:MAG: hypothetical protein WD010_01260, partial [Nitriliruptor sp.]